MKGYRMFTETIWNLGPQDLAPKTPTSTYLPNGKQLAEMAKQLIDCQTPRWCEVRYWRTIIGAPGDSILITRAATAVHQELCLRSVDESKLYTKAKFGFDPVLKHLSTPSNAFKSEEQILSGELAAQVFSALPQARDHEFAAANIENFMEDLSEGKYWLWTRKASYAFCGEKSLDRQKVCVYFWISKSTPCSFDVSFDLVSDAQESLTHGTYNIAVCDAHSRPMLISTIPTLGNFLREFS